MRGSVRVRIAPSPTGFAHVGSAYTALFNYAYAKRNKGKFILRLEDTDIKRQVKGAEKAIYDGLSWLGLSWDEGPDKGGRYKPYRQSERLEIYQKKAKELLDKKIAYEEDGAIRFKNPGQDLDWNDLVRGKISFAGGEVTDFVLLKSDEYPTYNFAVVVDDILMKISHVIRGEEHISNTPRQLALYKAFKVDPPQFAHLPTLRNRERKKLSKRRDPVDLRIFREQGYLPEALVNFLCLLGWSHPKGKEIFSINEFVKLFNLDRVRPAGPIFNIEKLEWLNNQYIQKLSDKEFAERVKPYSSKKVSFSELQQVAPLVKTRLKKLSEFEILAGFFFQEPKVKKSDLGKEWTIHLSEVYEALKGVSEWNVNAVNKVLLKVVEKNKFKTGEFFMNLRVAITGSRVTPPINESIVVLGKKETLERLGKFVS